MQTLISDYRRLCPVVLPYAARQKYMHSFNLANPKMADGFEDYLEPVIALCASAGAVKGMAHMTVDEKIVEAGMSQRRPKPHVDGCYVPAIGNWNHSGWTHYCNNISAKAVGRMPVIVASSFSGCRAWRGHFEASPASDGDLSDLLPQLGDGEVLPANVGYLLSADCVHESMILERSTARTFLRIALPVEFDF
jgi:hypothetical protein